MEGTVSALIKEYLATENEIYFKELLDRFSPLIKSYAKKLYSLEYEDSIQELSIALYEAVQKIQTTNNEYACISYIKKSVIHRFTKLYHESVQIQNEQNNTELLYDEKDQQHPYRSEADDCITKIDLENLLKVRSLNEKKMIYLLLQGYSDAEIAHELGYSRQYVNRLKKRIFNGF